jgi:hypothetical protein
MKTKKHNKRGNKLTKSLKGGAFGLNSVGLNGVGSEDENSKPMLSMMTKTLIVLGISSCYMFFKLTRA